MFFSPGAGFSRFFNCRIFVMSFFCQQNPDLFLTHIVMQLTGKSHNREEIEK